MSRLAGTGILTRLALRRDRVLLPAWVATFVLVTWFSAAASKDLYGSPAELARVAEGWNATTALVAMHGRIYDPTSLGAGSLVKMTGLGTALVGLFAILLVIRHTRADEEVGRTELAAGGAVGALAPLAAALLVAVGAVASLSGLSGLALLANGLPAAGSVAFALAWCGAGVTFAAVAAVAAQLAVTARAARGLAAAVLGTTYAVRALGDTAPADGLRWVHWLSPLGWAQQVRPFAGDRWWALLVPVAGSVLLLGLAVVLLLRRDLGAGLLTDRPGPARGTGIGSVTALAWRLQRWTLLGWATAVFCLGLLLGSIASTLDDLLDSPTFRDYLEILGGVSVLEDAFISAELTIAAIIVSAFGVGSALRMRSEEAEGQAEALLSTGVTRARFVAGHLAVALLGSGLLMLVLGVGLGASHALATGDPDQVARVVGAAVARIPAVWLMTAAVALFFGVSGRASPLAWVLLVGSLVLGEFGPLMDLPRWTVDLSPYAHLPALPGGTLEGGPLAWMLALAAAFLAGGVIAFGRRDLEPD